MKREKLEAEEIATLVSGIAGITELVLFMVWFNKLNQEEKDRYIALAAKRRGQTNVQD